MLNFRTVPDFLALAVMRGSVEEIEAVWDDKYQVFKHFHRALIGGDLRTLTVMQALLDDIFARLVSGKSYPARNVRQQDLYATLSRLRSCRKILEKRLADIKSIPNPPERIRGKHEDWREIAAMDAEFAIQKVVEMEKMANNTISLVSFFEFRARRGVLWVLMELALQ